jgi:hypothetical protein
VAAVQGLSCQASGAQLSLRAINARYFAALTM